MDMQLKQHLVRHLRLTRIKNGDYLDKVLTDDDLDVLANSILSNDSPISRFMDEDSAEHIEELQDEVDNKVRTIQFLRGLLKNAEEYATEASDALSRVKAIVSR